MDCREIVDQLSEYLDEQEKNDLCDQIELHLKACPSCRVYVDTVHKTILLYHDGPKSSVPVTVSAQLQARLAEAYRGGGEQRASD